MHKWEEGLIALNLELVEKLDDRKVVVRKDGFEFIVYKSNLSSRHPPTIASCTDKTGYFLHKYGDRLNSKLDYSKFVYTKGGEKSTVLCPIHGEILMLPDVLARGCGCNFCGNDASSSVRTHSHEVNLSKAVEVHGDRYLYGGLSVSAKTKVEIQCPEHGVFRQSLDNHISGKKGCPVCAKESNPAFNRSSFGKYPKYYLYVMNMWNKESGEEFMKIGISHNPDSRCRQLNTDSGGDYSAEVLYKYESDGETCWDLEKLLHREFDDFKYTPKMKFKGSTECFSWVDVQAIGKIAQCCA